MVKLLEKELEIRDQELKELLKDLSMDTMPNLTTKVNAITTEKEMLHKLLKEQKVQRRKGLFAMENGLLLFAIAMFGGLAAFVFYLLSGAATIEGTWEQMGSQVAVLILLFVMTTVSSVLYLQHYRQKFTNR